MSSEIPADPYRAILNSLNRLSIWAQASEDEKGAIAPAVSASLNPAERDTWSYVYIEQLKFLHSRRPSIFKTGLVGSIPSFARPGDVLCIFLGAKIPYVLRPLSDASETYILIGEAFVYGIMDGEALEMGYQARYIKLQ
jgi:hypothetical protein